MVITIGLKLDSFHTRIFLGNLDDASRRGATFFLSKSSTDGGGWRSNLAAWIGRVRDGNFG